MSQYDSFETGRVRSADSVLHWAHNLAAGSLDDQLDEGYIHTVEYDQLRNRLIAGTGGIMVVFGTQGVGKTAALRHLFYELNPKEHSQDGDLTFLLVNWVDMREQIWDFPPANRFFVRHSSHPSDLMIESISSYRLLALTELKSRFIPIKLPKGKELPTRHFDLDRVCAEELLGKSSSGKLTEGLWFDCMASKKGILIDLPDYAKTDRRILNRHLSQISQLWNRLEQREKRPVLVIAVQKELIGTHYFIDKANTVELRPLTGCQMLASYKGTFGSTFPFTEPALVALANLSRGIYRRFKRYIAIAIESCPQKPPVESVTEDQVRKTITIDRVAEDMNLELEHVFPKNPESRREGVQILLRLSELGSLKQAKLAKDLDIPEYSLSRLLSKLELHRYVKRQSHGSQKIVSLREL
jgi:hypothetical protein